LKIEIKGVNKFLLQVGGGQEEVSTCENKINPDK